MVRISFEMLKFGKLIYFDKMSQSQRAIEINVKKEFEIL